MTLKRFFFGVRKNNTTIRIHFVFAFMIKFLKSNAINSRVRYIMLENLSVTVKSVPKIILEKY